MPRPPISQRRISVLLLALAVSAAVPLNAQDKTLADRVDGYLAPYVAGNNFLGAVLIAKGDKILVSRGYGNASYEFGVANTASTRFHIASVSKPFTAACILLLEQRNMLQVSDPISRFLPDFPYAGKITLEHLLTHTSGIANVNSLPDYDAASRFPQTPASLIKLFQNKPLNFEPGTKYEYSNSNYNILAFVIEQVSGKSYGQFLEENLFSPLALADTGHDGTATDLIKNGAIGYQPRGLTDLERAPYIDWSAKTGNGSLYSTTADLFRFVRAYRTGRILPQSVVDRIWTEKPGNNYGWFVRKKRGLLAIGSNGRSPGFTSSVEYYPGQDLTVIVLSNSYSPVSQSPISDDLAALAIGELARSPAPPSAIHLQAKDIQAIAGDYEFDQDYYRPNAKISIHTRGNALVLDWGNNFESAMIPVSPTEFIERQFWSMVRLLPDRSGFTYTSSGSTFRATKISPK